MRPDLYYRMVEAYYYRQQLAWLPFRRLAAIVANMARSEESEPVEENQIEWLTMIDTPPPPKIKSEPVYWDDEKVKAFQRSIGIITE